MRKIQSLLLGGLSILGVSVAFSNAAQAQIEVAPVKEAELACEQALKIGTIEALEDYLHRYPNAPTACKALALNSLAQFSADGGSNGNGDGGHRYGG
ncbi:hypothetical protein EJ070_31365 [Mesorhizobium sp. M1E.F.Ca.ET.045.02.1.1]|uniref:hypothetical protein n=1 Tax=unclassified Mesorhizobium TaxID=325217 RepID=UPI000F7584C7|nr:MULTISPECIES: hypothetical protein [unclassified Mesorhizobium]AZO24726.1 hypothetical protein EJ070_31365 [Mesorhizobium sp. M1E.F.Ca.ET.045.02.1.1]RUW36174.1 hypothetical protein EOA38_06665 [Mesorhizobium sp. M1E.F.Ca.ET.041.01.1.1]RUW85079.1 hypothetical protein EOA29_06495 [Mesorhizobium sp. M1E.F.Ca.ET.063.01.1.1]RWB52669.1 MAG: hypothetical protein EOQ47_25235 [Mesorhizobium sp.]RWD88209.1 MAG: hypothetical protein EOS38_15810 [Mesorhizobium sp.]